MTDTTFDAQYRAALLVLADRYAAMARNDDLIGDDRVSQTPFIGEIRESVLSGLPLMKLNRWIGYVQGVLIERGHSTVEIERDFTRPYLRPLDFPKRRSVWSKIADWLGVAWH